MKTVKELRDMLNTARIEAIKAIWDHIADRTIELKRDIRFTETADENLTTNYVIKRFDLNKVWVEDVVDLDLMEASGDEHEWTWNDLDNSTLLLILAELEEGRFEDYDD